MGRRGAQRSAAALAAIGVACATVACAIDTTGSLVADAGLPAPDASTNSDSRVANDASVSDGAGDVAPEAAPVDPCAPTAGLLVCMRFEGDLTDRAGTLVNPSQSSSLSYGPGALGQALRLSTSPPSFLRYSSPPSMGSARTMEMWVDPVTIPPTGRAVFVDIEDVFALAVYPGGTLHCRLNDVTSSVSIAVNTWTHVACTRDGSNLRVYVGGALVGTAPSQLASGNGGSIGIGHDEPGQGENYDGWIDELRIWSTVRTDQEIQRAATR